MHELTTHYETVALPDKETIIKGGLGSPQGGRALSCVSGHRVQLVGNISWGKYSFVFNKQKRFVVEHTDKGRIDGEGAEMAASNNLSSMGR